jgi:hypothetical protein
MEIELIWKITGLGHLLIACLLPPTLMIYLRKRKPNSEQKWTTYLLVSVLITWIIRSTYRMTIEVPINIQRARNAGDEMYDGVGGNVVTLFFGWLEPLIFCLLTILIFKVIKVLKRNTEPAAG